MKEVHKINEMDKKCLDEAKYNKHKRKIAMKLLLVDDEELALDLLKEAVATAVPNADITAVDDVQLALDAVNNTDFDVAFLDVEMPGMTGIELAGKIREKSPHTNIVFVTAYSDYAVQAARTYFSGYFVKPVTSDMIKEAMENLRFPIEETNDFFVQCFGNFEVFYKGKPLNFSRKAAKEVFAYLIYLRGASATVERLCETLWPDDFPGPKEKSYLRHIIADLSKALKECGKEDIFIRERNAFSIVPSKIECDFFKFLNGDAAYINKYCGEYMEQYEWSLMPMSWKY